MDNKIFLGNIGKLRFTLYVKERQIVVGYEITDIYRYPFSEFLFTRISGGIKREIQRKIEIKEEEFEDTLKKEFLIFDDSSLTIRYSSQKKFFLLGSVSQVVESIEDVARLLYSHILTKAIYLSSPLNEAIPDAIPVPICGSKINDIIESAYVLLKNQLNKNIKDNFELQQLVDKIDSIRRKL